MTEQQKVEQELSYVTSASQETVLDAVKTKNHKPGGVTMHYSISGLQSKN
jgi:hypothetical protein